MMKFLDASPAGLDEAAAILRDGGLVALPTETVYGLAADAAQPEAVRKIFAAKGRPADHPLIVHVAHLDDLAHWCAEVPPLARQLAEVFWPGPLTLVLPVGDKVTPLVTGGQPTIAVRMPAHPVMLGVLQRLGSGLAAPSANPFGRISPTTVEHVAQGLAERIDAVVDGGACGVGIESTILDLSSPQAAILRPGAITAEMLAPYLEVQQQPAREAPRVPGALASHYAPRTPTYLFADAAEAAALMAATGAQRVGVLSFAANPVPAHCHWTLPASAEDCARELYALLHEADLSGCDLLLVERLPASDDWLAVRDRLNRAALAAPAM